MAVITLSGQYGAGRDTVADLLGARLGWEIVDRQVVVEIANRLGMPQDEVEARVERPGKLLDTLLRGLGSAPIDYSPTHEAAAWTPPYADPAFDPRRAILSLTQEIVRETAEIGNAILVGHGSAYLLRDRAGVTRVFVRAAREVRKQRVLERYQMASEEAERRMKEVDANRSAYIRQVYGHDWYHTANYDLIVDTGTLGYEASVAAIVAAVKARP